MDRVCGRLVAALRGFEPRRALAVLVVLLLTLGLLRIGPPDLTGPAAAAESGSYPAHVDSAADPDPSPALTKPQDAELRGAEDDDLAHGLRPGFALSPARADDVRRSRGPPLAMRDATWRPRSSRGPPGAVVLAVPSFLSAKTG